MLPQFKTGRYSKHLPARLAARFQEAQSDPELISLHDDVALIDVRLAELVARVGDDDPRALWGRAEAELEAFREAHKRGSREQVAALARLADTIAEGINDAPSATWRQITDLLEQRRRLVESESKRLQQLQQMIPAEGVLLLMGLIEQTIRAHVTDKSQLEAISRELVRLGAQQPRRIIDAESGS